MALFARDFQQGTYFEVLSAQGSNPLANWRLSSPKHVRKIYDKSTRGYVFDLGSGTQPCRMQLPNDKFKSVSLVQPFLVLQVCVAPNDTLGIELHVTDRGGNKRRLMLSTAYSKVTRTSLHVQLPLPTLLRDTWVNLSLDLSNIISGCFPREEFRTIDGIAVSAQGRLRRIFTLRSPPMDTVSYLRAMPGALPVPAAVDFPATCLCQTQLIAMADMETTSPHSRTANSAGFGASRGGAEPDDAQALASSQRRKGAQGDTIVAFGSRFPTALSPAVKGRQRGSSGSHMQGLLSGPGSAPPGSAGQEGIALGGVEGVSEQGMACTPTAATNPHHPYASPAKVTTKSTLPSLSSTPTAAPTPSKANPPPPLPLPPPPPLPPPLDSAPRGPQAPAVVAIQPPDVSLSGDGRPGQPPRLHQRRPNRLVPLDMRAIRDLGATDNVHPPAHQIAHSAGSNGAHDHRPSSDRVPSASASEAPSPAEAPPNPAPAAPPGATQPPRVPGAQRQVPPVAGRGGVGSSGASGDERGDESASGSASGRGSSGGPGGGLVRRRSRRLSSLVRAVPDASSPAARGLYEFATDPRSRGPAAGVAAAAGAHVGVSVDVAASLDSRVVDSVDLGVRGSIRAPGNPALTRSRQSHHRGPSDPLAESAAASSVASMIDMASEHPHGASGSPSAAPLFVGIGRLSGEGNHSGSHAWTGALASSVASTASRWGTRPSPRYAAAPGGPWGASDPASSEEDAAGDSVAGKEVDAPSISGGAAGGIRRRRSIKARAGEGGEREGEGGEGLGAGVSIQGVRAPVSPSTRLRQSRRGGAGQMSADGPGAERQGREGDGGEWGGSFAGGGDVTSSLVVGSAPVWFGAAGKGIPSPGSPRKGIRSRRPSQEGRRRLLEAAIQASRAPQPASLDLSVTGRQSQISLPTDHSAGLMLPAGGKPSPQAIVEHRDASIGAAEPARRQGRASFEDPGLFSRQVPPPGAPVPSGSPPPRPSSAEAVGGAREGGKSPGTGAGRRRRSEESLSASQSHQSVGRVLAGRPGTEGSGRRVGAWEGVIESGAGQEVASVEAWGAEVGEGVRRSEGGGVAGPGGAGGKSPLKKGTTVRRRASSGFELGSLWAQDGADGPQSPPQAAHAPPSAQGTPSGGAAFLTDDSEAGLVSGVMDRTPRSSETQRRESSGIQGPLRGGQSPEPSPAFVRRHDAADRVRGFFEARAAPSPSPSPSPPPARVPSASLPPAGPSKGAARFAVHVASATPLDASTTPPRRSDAANALSVSPDGASALLVSPGDRGGPSARDGRGSRDRSGPVEDAESRGGTAYSLGSLASGKGPGTPSVAWPHRDSNGYALSTEHSHGRLSDWDHDLTSLVRSGLFTPPVVPASRIDGRRGREASAPERRKEDGGEGDAQVFHNDGVGNNQQVIDLIYDPMLNCYYDAATSQYYAIK